MKKKIRKQEPFDLEKIRVDFSPKNHFQVEAIQALKKSAICFLTGPAGSAKTFVATAWALKQMLQRDMKLWVSRPAVSQGASIGYIPGTAEQKVAPYLAPIFEATEKLVGEAASVAIRKQINILPLAFIRGRTIENATLFIDEAQNLSWSEIKTICTRIGENGQIIFCGDIGQNDHHDKHSPLEEAARTLHGIEAGFESISWYQLPNCAIVRHPLVEHVIERMGEASP